MMLRRIYRALGLSILCGACAGASLRERPAVLAHPSAEVRATLARDVAEALHRDQVLLADDALVHDSELIIEPVRPRDAAGLPLQGRELRAPEHFRLVKSGGRCILIHQEDGRRFRLPGARCALVTQKR